MFDGKDLTGNVAKVIILIIIAVAVVGWLIGRFT
jgi:type IV secretory pathway VirB2 component (pilin)